MLHLYLYILLFRKRAANKNWVICLLIVSFFMLSMLRETLLYTFLSDINKRITYAWTYFLNQNCHLNSFKRNQTFQNRFCKLLNIYNLFLTKKNQCSYFITAFVLILKEKIPKLKNINIVNGSVRLNILVTAWRSWIFISYGNWSITRTQKFFAYSFIALIERYIYVAELNVNGHLAINNRCIWCTCELSYLHAHIVARMGEQLSAAKDYTRVYWFWQGAICFKLPCLEAIDILDLGPR